MSVRTIRRSIYESIQRRPMIIIGLLLLCAAVFRIWMTDFSETAYPKEERVTIYGVVRTIEEDTCVILAEDHRKYVLYPEESVLDLLSVGNRVEAKGDRKLYNVATNPGQFDSRRYYRIRGVYGKILHCQITVTNTECFYPGEIMRHLKERLSESLNAIYDRNLFSSEVNGIIHTILLGDKKYLEEESKDLYRRAGLAHILAVSGLHVSFFGMGCFRLLRKCRCKEKAAAVTALFVTAIYILLIGAGPSAERAGLFFALSMLAQITGRGKDMPVAWILSGSILITANPLWLLDAGFHMSFASTGAIGILEPWVQPFFWEERFSVKKTGKVQKAIRGAECGLWIQLLLLPIMLCTYFEYPIYSMLLNLLVLPLMPLVLGAAACSMLVGLAIPVFGVGIGCLSGWALECIGRCAAVCLELPGAVQICAKPSVWQVLFYYVLLFGTAYGVRSRRLQRKRVGMTFVILLAVPLVLLFKQKADLTVAFLDVGQGDCICIYTDSGFCAVVDCGTGTAGDVGKYRLLPYLKANGIKRIDYLFLTHMDRDHISGARELLESYGEMPISNLLLTQSAYQSETGAELVCLAEHNLVKTGIITKGDSLSSGKLFLKCLYPDREVNTMEDGNGTSLVLEVTMGDFRCLLMGDLDKEGEEKLLREPLCVQTVLKVGHHGSNTSTGEIFAETVRPLYSVLSCGRNNRYGHPHWETTEALEEIGSDLLCTMDTGCIEFRTNGIKMTIQQAL